MCGIEKHRKKEAKAQSVALRSDEKHNGLLKCRWPGRMDRRKHGVNRGDFGRSRQIFLKNTIDKKHAPE
jgi:hypothetical protein